MAVQKSKCTRRRRGNRRAHDKIKKATLAIEPGTGETHRRHHVSADGYYRGKKAVFTKKPAQLRSLT